MFHTLSPPVCPVLESFVRPKRHHDDIDSDNGVLENGRPPPKPYGDDIRHGF